MPMSEPVLHYLKHRYHAGQDRKAARHDRQTEALVSQIGDASPADVSGRVDRVLGGARDLHPLTKRALILALCRGRSVLDLGCVQHSWRMSIENPHWLHSEIAEVAADCTGVDYLEADVIELNRRGYHMIVGDVLKDDPPGQYDVVVAGDLIEHLDNPGLFLEYIGKALRPEGLAVITTPNAFDVNQLWTILANRKPDINPEHVSNLDPFTMEKLVERSPLRIAEMFWLHQSWWAFCSNRRLSVRIVAGLLLAPFTAAVVRWRPYLRSDFAVILRRDEDHRAPFDPEVSASRVTEYLHPNQPGHVAGNATDHL